MTRATITTISLLSVLFACGGSGGESETDGSSTSTSTSSDTEEPPTGTSGEVETSSSSSGTTGDPSTGDPSTGDPSTGEEPPPACMPGEGGSVLVWAQSAEALPGFMPGLAGGPDDSVVVAGRTAVGNAGDAFVELRDAAGAAIWSDVYAGANNLEDNALDVAIDPAGFIHVLVRESILSIEAEMMGTYDARLVVLRYAPDGAHAWRWEHERPPVEPWNSFHPAGKLAADGETIVVLEQAFDHPFELVRLDAAGNLLGEATLTVPDNLDYKTRYDLGADGSPVLAGRAESPDRLWVGRFDELGAPSWSLELEDDASEVDAVLAGKGGAAYIVGPLDVNPGLLSVRKFAGDGAVEWTQALPDAGLDGIRFGGAVRSDGALLLLGGNEKQPQPGNEWGQRKDLWLGLMAADGALAWTFEQEFGLPFSWGDGNTAVFTAGGAVVVSGSFLGEDGGTYQPWLGRLCGD